jgi:L-aspartate oxidase
VTQPDRGHAGTVRPSVNAERSDLVVVGAGAAGLFACLTAARHGARVTLVSARPLAETASYWAQGGLAAALAAEDSADRHFADTMTAGRGIVRGSAARTLVDEAPARFHDLEELGVRFDADRHGNVALGLEGGHSVRRVVHAGGSATGRRILRQLSADVAEQPAIDVLEGARAAELIADERCTGVRLEDGRTLVARGTILATGGAAALWSRTTNPPGSFGSGLLLARAAGAALADLEFVQFHPTAVVGIPGREGYLITEAIRGEGATLHDTHGERFVEELAPRDEVARALFRTLRDQHVKAVSLDMRHIDPARFPNVVAALREAGLDPATEPVPVAPASHYVMGGIVTDLEGRSHVPGLYAVGECACTGLHGANRLASNSLSECFVFGRRAALRALDEPESTGAAGPAPTEPVAPPPSRATRAAMWRHAGLERDADGLRALLDDPHPLARLVARSALFRGESRGAHARADFPATDPALDERHTVVDGDAPRLEHWV